ncbi:hypothetical protein LG3211_0752 [Lysobacter gummosus]|nr:hypothetical protein LG3211_0752 [Lysobacter gummosus]
MYDSNARAIQRVATTADERRRGKDVRAAKRARKGAAAAAMPSASQPVAHRGRSPDSQAQPMRSTPGRGAFPCLCTVAVAAT